MTRTYNKHCMIIPKRYFEMHCALVWLWLDIKDKYIERKAMRLKKNKHR